MATTMIATRAVTVRQQAKNLSSRCASYSPVAPKLAATPGMTRLASLVVEARTGSPAAVDKAMSAVRELEAPVAVRGALTAVVSNVLLAGPANAGVLFDFNLTLPIIAGQFLALMFIMDKLVYSPVGEVLDKRDGELRSKLMAVKDNSAELGALAAEADAILGAARSDATETINAAKKKTEAECSKKVADAKAKMDKELAAAYAALMSSKEESMKNLDGQVEKLSNQIVEKVIPA